MDFINISNQSITTLGKMLMPSYVANMPFDMPFGRCVSIYAALKALPEDIVFTSFDGYAKKDLFGSKVTTTLVNTKMGYIVAILKHISN